MTVVAETWMPVSGTFREYVLDPQYVYWEDGPTIYSKGHHDPEAFLTEAIQLWWDENGPQDEFVPEASPRLRVENVRQEWWATRCDARLEEYYRYAIEPVQPWQRGAYPVTVVDCV